MVANKRREKGKTIQHVYHVLFIHTFFNLKITLTFLLCLNVMATTPMKMAWLPPLDRSTDMMKGRKKTKWPLKMARETHQHACIV
jgi:hypothetical protein